MILLDRDLQTADIDFPKLALGEQNILQDYLGLRYLVLVHQYIECELRFLILFFVVWQGIYDPDQTQKKDGDRGFILLQPTMLPESDAGSNGVEPLFCHPKL